MPFQFIWLGPLQTIVSYLKKSYYWLKMILMQQCVICIAESAPDIPDLVVRVVEAGDVLQQVGEDGVGRLRREDRVLDEDEQGPGKMKK